MEKIKKEIIKEILSRYERLYTPQFCNYLKKEIKLALDSFEEKIKWKQNKN